MTTKEQRDELRASKTPVEDLLRTIPNDLVIQFEAKGAWHNCPIGRHAKEAAELITELRASVLDSQQPASVDASVEPGAYPDAIIIALQVAANALEIASDWSLPATQCNPPKEWNLPTGDDSGEAGWCSTYALAEKLREIASQHPSIAPASEMGQADERTYEDGLLRAAEICRRKHANGNWAYDTREECADAIEKEAKK